MMVTKLFTRRTGCYTLFNLYAFLAFFMFYRVFERALPFLVVFVFATPLLLVAEHVLIRSDSTGFGSRYSLISKVFLGCTWFIFLVSIFPMNTARVARQGVEEVLGKAVPSSVSRMYFKVDHGWQDSAYWIKFTCLDRSIVEHLIRKYDLTESSSFEDGGGASSPYWWDLREKNVLLGYSNTQGKYRRYLWFDLEESVVYFFSYSI